MSCIFLSLSSVSLLTKERSSLRVCSRSKIAGDDLKFGTQSFNGATPVHVLCDVRTHLIQHGRLWTGQNDQLQETLIGSINKTVDDVTLQLSDVKNSLIEIEKKTSDIILEFNKIKEYASDLQTFLSIEVVI
jgi:hypothetical protein